MAWVKDINAVMVCGNLEAISDNSGGWNKLQEVMGWDTLMKTFTIYISFICNDKVFMIQ